MQHMVHNLAYIFSYQFLFSLFYSSVYHAFDVIFIYIITVIIMHACLQRTA